jgi:hypothetical protein
LLPFCNLTINWKTSYFAWKKILEMLIFLDLFSEKKFCLLVRFLHFVHNKSYDDAICSSKRLYNLKSLLDHLNTKFESAHVSQSVMCQ